MKVLTVRQPWAHLIAAGGKDIENRTWTTRYRGPVLIHASQKIQGEDIAWVRQEHGINLTSAKLRVGVTICIVDLTDVVTDHKSRWFEGPYGFVLKNARAVPNVWMRGQMGFFDVPDHVKRQIR